MNAQFNLARSIRSQRKTLVSEYSNAMREYIDAIVSSADSDILRKVRAVIRPSAAMLSFTARETTF